MAEFAVHKSEKSSESDVCTLTISGEMTILHAVEARDALIDAFADEEPIIIDINGITEIDLTGLQLLCAAHRASSSSRNAFTVDSSGNNAFKAAAETAGFPRHVGCMLDQEKCCIWIGGENGQDDNDS